MTIDRTFIDTNIFLRYLTNDLPEKANQVEALLHCNIAGDFSIDRTRSLGLDHHNCWHKT